MTKPKHNKLLYTKSFSSIYDIIGSVSRGDSISKTLNKPSMYSAACGESLKQSLDYEYIVSEKYNPLINDSSCKTVIPSTSTIFYDLDEIAKRHSFHCFTEPSQSHPNFMKVMKVPHFNVFGGEATAIVQECATQMHPKLLPRDSKEEITKRVKKKHSRLSSEISLRDDDYMNDRQRSHYYKDNKSRRQQKFWSYSKYRTEYSKPIPEEKKSKKKDRGKRTEDPCPCQLFSYACPCTDKKSLTELAKNSKSLTIVDQVTSTTKSEQKNKDTKTNNVVKNKHDLTMEDKLTNTSAVKMIEVTVPNKKNDPPAQITNTKDVQNLADKNNVNKNPKTKLKPNKKLRKVVCPNCKEKVDVEISLSTTEEENLNYEHSSVYRSEEIPSTTAFSCRAGASPNRRRSKIMEEGDLCLHEPRCELLPVCQILPNDNFYNVNQKSVNNQSVSKSMPRVIRITKACRHHPPCTVVPSCQRATVLKNNCEYIPPCLHRPRCVNTPLCVPLSKNLHYEETTNKLVEDLETADCPHIPRCKFVPECQHESNSNTMNHQINIIPRVQNACGFLNDYNTPTFLVNPTQPTNGNTFSSFPLSPTNTCFTEQFTYRSNKSCQFDTSNYKCSNEFNENPSEETVVFIRDVGCQFRNKTYSPKDSVLEAKVSNNSIDFVDVKMGNYYTNVHTLRYEDKCTGPLSGAEQSYSTMSITSLSLDHECPSHGQRQKHDSHGLRPATGFTPKSAYITAFSSVEQPLKYGDNKSEAFLIKSRRQFLKGKYKKFSVKRRRKSRMSTLCMSVHNSSMFEPSK